MTQATGWGDGGWGERSWSGLNNEWFIGRDAVSISSLSIDSQTVSFRFEIPANALDYWRQFDEAGDVAVQSGFAGVFHVVEQGEDSSIELYPGRKDYPAVDRSADWFVDGYSEEQIAPGRFAIELTCIRQTNRDESTTRLTETGWSSDGWGDGGWGGTSPPLKIELPYGTLAVDEGSIGQISGDGSPSGEAATLPLLVSAAQLGAFADAIGSPDAVVERAVPDGENRAVDGSPNSTQTLTLSTASDVDLDLDDGDYLARDWSASYYSQNESHRYQIELTLQETP